MHKSATTIEKVLAEKCVEPSLGGGTMRSPWGEDEVTFQVGMVGSDGVVLASDRLVTKLIGVRSTSLMEKSLWMKG